MDDANLRRYIEQLVRQQVNILLGGTAQNGLIDREDIVEMYPGMPTQLARPTVRPYGLASRAPAGTRQITGRVGENTGARAVLGHLDGARPAGLAEGESVLYSRDGYRVRVRNGEIQVGKGDTYETVVVGDTLKALLIALLDFYVQHKHIGNLGYYTSQPDNAANVQQLKTENLDNDKILAKDNGRF